MRLTVTEETDLRFHIPVKQQSRQRLRTQVTNYCLSAMVPYSTPFFFEDSFFLLLLLGYHLVIVLLREFTEVARVGPKQRDKFISSVRGSYYEFK